MRWFKHNLKHTPAVEQFIDDHGLFGYGLYMRLLELFAENIETSPEAVATHGYLHNSYCNNQYAYLVKKLQISDHTQYNSIIQSLIDYGLLVDDEGKLYCPQMKDWLDTYTKRRIKEAPHIPSPPATPINDDSALQKANEALYKKREAEDVFPKPYNPKLSR